MEDKEASRLHASAPVTIYNIMLLGAGGVGKTSFVTALYGKEFNSQYTPTQPFGDDLPPMSYILSHSTTTNIFNDLYDPKRQCYFIVHDYPGTYEYESLDFHQNLMKRMDGFIIMVDLGRPKLTGATVE